MKRDEPSRRRRTGVLSLLVCALLVASVREVRAKWKKYAIVVGYNGVVQGTGRDPLDYADDDAVRNASLWRQLRTDVVLLTSMDGDTRKRFGNASPDGVPTLEAIKRAVADINQKALADREAGKFSVAYFAYSGHGGMLDGDGYITLADGPMRRLDFYKDVLARLQTDRVHVVIDACSAAAMARSGDATEVRPFRQPIYRAERSQFRNAGFLLPSSSPTQTYEWRRYRGGVFGYLVRSALRGAADADGDGRISYREIESFVACAQVAVDAAFRPATLADPPPDDDTFLYIDPSLGTQSLTVDVNLGDHLYVADDKGNRHFDLRPGNQVFRVLLPLETNRLYAINLDKNLVYELPRAPAIKLSSLLPREYAPSKARGPGPEFERMFGATYDFRTHLAHQHDRAVYDQQSVAMGARSEGKRDGITWMLAATGGVTAVAGLALLAGSHWQLRTIDVDAPASKKARQRSVGRQLAGGGWTLATTAVLTAGAAAVWRWAMSEKSEE